MAESGTGKFRSLQNRERAAGLRGNEPAVLPPPEGVVQEPFGSGESRKLPNERRDEAMGVIKFRRPAIELMPQGIIPRARGEASIETCDARSRGKIVDAL